MDTLRQEYLFLPFSYKDCYLAYVCSEFAGSSAIIFCCTCSNAQRIAIMLRAQPPPPPPSPHPLVYL